MIQTVSDAKAFFEIGGAPTFIYGAGNPGQWVAEYMERCNTEYEGFIDRAAGKGECFLNKKRIISPDKLNQYANQKLKIIIAIGKPEEALAELHWYAANIDVLCLLPVYQDFIYNKKVYDINKLLSFFRDKLFQNEVPTILSDVCTAGFIYRALGKMMKSPTVNTAIYPKDFLKICKDPHGYLEQDIVFDHWTVKWGIRCPVGKLGDVEVIFAHSNNPAEAVNRWNRLRRWIDWENMIYILSSDLEVVPYHVAREFCELPVKHLFMQKNCIYSNLKGSICFADTNPFLSRNSAVENWFDLLRWLNGEDEI